MIISQAYVYKWTHLPTLKWYVGSRTANKCHPNDGYICSSKIVKPMIIANPNDWRRDIIATGDAKLMRELESEILQTFDAANDTRSFNLHNASAKFSTKGLKRPDLSERNLKRAAAGGFKPNLGKFRTEEQKNKTRGDNHYTKVNKDYVRPPTTEEHKQALRRPRGPKAKTNLCEYCNKLFDTTNFNRWHSDKCKQKEQQ